jgi:nitrogen fixation/metabolism regulation signal transduction histidine kinase
MSNGDAQKAKFRRRTFLVDKRFQLKYTIIIAVIGALIAVLWGSLFYQANRENSEQVMLTLKVDPELQALSEKVEDKLSGEDAKILYYLSGFILAVVLSLIIWGVLITHRIAGPIFIISRYVDQVTAGEYPDPRPLRKKDELREFFIKFNDMLTSIKEREKTDVEALGKAIESGKSVLASVSGDRAEEFAKTIEMLRDLQERKQKMLVGPAPLPPPGDGKT